MNLGNIYQYIYLIIVTIISINVFNQYGTYDGKYLQKYPNNQRAFFILLFFILFIGLRPHNSAFVDMGAYDLMLGDNEGRLFEFNSNTDNIVFDNFFFWWGCNGYNHTLFFLIMATVYFGCAYIGIKRLFPDHYLLAYLVFLAAFSTFTYGTNGIKAGAAASIFVMALGFMDKKWISIPLAFLSLGAHHGMKVCLVAYFIVMFVKNPKYYFYGWFLSLIMAALHITAFQTFFAGFTDEQGASYLLATEATTTARIGFRPDFILYSAMPVWIGYKYEYKNQINISKTYSTLLHLYLTTNAVWMLCMYASYNNRIAYLSWLLYPIVIIYPYLDPENDDEQRYAKLKKVAFYHLVFTLFMVFVYYGVFHFGR